MSTACEVNQELKFKNAFHCKQHLLSQGRWVLQAVCLPAQRHLILDLCQSRRGLQAQVASLTLTWVSTKSINACDNSIWRRNNQHVILRLLSNQVELVNKSTFTVFLLSDRVKAEMDLKELSETVQLQQQQNQQQQQGGTTALTTPKRPIRSLDKTIESCKAQLGTFTISDILTFFH